MWAIGFSSKTRRESPDHTDHEGVKEKGIVVKQIRRNGVLALAVFVGLLLVYQSWEQRTGSDDIKGVIASQLQKSHLVTQMLADLLASVEAERNAVVAGSDAESEQYAAQAEALTEKVEQRRKELLSVIEKEPAGTEAKLLGEFSTAWEEFLTVDRELLGQAVLNTNLKAYRLSSNEAFLYFTAFARAMRETVASSKQSPDGSEIAEQSVLALGMVANILALQAPHIAESSDVRMDVVEKEMTDSFKVAHEAMTRMLGMASGQALRALQSGQAALNDFEAANTEVVRLSRINSNVKALALSMGMKRRVTAKCEEILETLRAANDSRLSKATR